MRKIVLHQFAMFVTLLLAGSCGAVPSAAQAIKVVGGETTTLAEGKQKLNLLANPPQKHGRASVETTGQGEAQSYKIIYKADEVKEKTSDQVAYTVGDAPPTAAAAQTVNVEIAPATLGFTGAAYEAGFKALFLLFVLAVVLESALAVLFNWRPFVEFLNARAVRPLISFLVALIFVYTFSLDLVTSLVNAATTLTYDPNTPGKILTALVLAGGSAGVNNLFVALGYRQQRTPEIVAPRPPPTQAWISVKIARKQAAGPVQVFMGAPPLPPLVGVLTGSSLPGVRFFLADPGRFPSYGGHAVPANSQVSVHLKGRNSAGGEVSTDWGPYTVAGGAFVDLHLSI